MEANEQRRAVMRRFDKELKKLMEKHKKYGCGYYIQTKGNRFDEKFTDKDLVVFKLVKRT